MIYFIRWYVAISLLGWLALPIAYKLFRRLPDRGYAFSKPLGLLAGSYLTWLLGSMGFLGNDVAGILFGVLGVALLGFAWLKRAGLDELRNWLRERRGMVLGSEALFLLAFAAWTLVRAYNPQILGTEKPMEFMFINSILRSPAMPPQDAWLSNHAISYYYFGYVMVAALIRITATPAAVGFNLGLGLLFGLTAVSVHGLLVNLIACVQAGRDGRGDAPANLRGAFWPALLGPVLVLLAGNLYGPLELAYNNGLFAGTRLPAVWYDFGSAPDSPGTRSLADFETPPGARFGWIGLWEWLDLKQLEPPPSNFPAGVRWTLPNWFFASRAVHDRNLTGVETEAIDEFPAFSFLLGDMHPHVLSLPFVVVVMGLAFEMLLSGRALGRDEVHLASLARGGELGRFLVACLLLGGIFFLNSWDFPIYLFLCVAAFSYGLALRHGLAGALRLWRLPASFAVGLFAIGLGAYWPFLLSLKSQAGGILPNLVYPTRMQQSIVMFAPPLVGVGLFLGWLARRARRVFARRAALWAGLGILLLLVLAAGLLSLLAAIQPGTSGLVAGLVSPLSIDEALRLMLQRRLVDSLTALTAALFIALSVGVGLGLLAVHAAQAGEQTPPGVPAPPVEAQLPGAPALGMVLVMSLTAGLLWLAPEFVYLRDYFGTRMNTLFKFYFQVWVLWAILAAFGAWYVARVARGWVRSATLALTALGLLLGSVYLAGGLASKTGNFAGPPALDGMAYFARDYPDDWAAIRWLQENVPGQAVILEGSRGAYWIEGRSSRFSMATGLPTLMGWANHESQWRGEYFGQVAGRQNEIAAIYQARDWRVTQELLDKYNVEYVIVSPLEREWYAPLYEAKFDTYMQAVFEQGQVVIYRR